MPVRFPLVAGMFYPADRTSCHRQVEECLSSAPSAEVQSPIQAGVVPHAGWSYSGPTAGRVFAAIKGQGQPETFVLFGAVHTWEVTDAAMYSAGSWRTPLGDLAIDEELAQAILLGCKDLVVDEPQAHAQEHSIEVQLPFIKLLFPEARILPIAAPPSLQAPELGREVARVVRQSGRKAVAVGSSDLTHYGPRYGMSPAGIGERALGWARQNDAHILDLAVAMRADEIVPEAQAHHNACGAGAIAAAIGFAAELGATKGTLLGYTTSHEVMPMGRPTDFVGYGAVVFA
jgi:hypothetical protein